MGGNLFLIAGYDRFFSGRDIDYGYLMLQFDLSRITPRKKPVKR